MLAKSPFYYGTTRKMVIAFCGLFNNIFIRTKDKSGTTQKIVPVPLAYANKEKMLVRLNQDPGLNEDAQITLPRMSAEIVGFEYDSDRQMVKTNRQTSVRDGRTGYQYSPVPWNLSFNLYAYTLTQEDTFQIMEQILPYFTPDMNLSVKIMKDPDVVQDCTLILNDVNIDDQYDGSFEDRRYIITTYLFTLQMNYFGPILGSFDAENHFENGETVSVIKKVITNLNTLKYTATVDPFEANEDDVHSIDENWTL